MASLPFFPACDLVRALWGIHYLGLEADCHRCEQPLALGLGPVSATIHHSYLVLTTWAQGSHLIFLGLRFLICTRKKFTTFHKCAARKCVQHIVIGTQWTLTEHWINKRQRLYLSYLPLSSPQMSCVMPTTNKCSLGVCKTSKIGWWWRHRRLESILNWQVLLTGKESLGLSL